MLSVNTENLFVGIYRDIFGDLAKSITLHTSRGFRSNTTIAGMQTICFDIFQVLMLKFSFSEMVTKI